jgi:hypothetical protein
MIFVVNEVEEIRKGIYSLQTKIVDLKLEPMGTYKVKYAFRTGMKKIGPERNLEILDSARQEISAKMQQIKKMIEETTLENKKELLVAANDFLDLANALSSSDKNYKGKYKAKHRIQQPDKKWSKCYPMFENILISKILEKLPASKSFWQKIFGR